MTSQESNYSRFEVSLDSIGLRILLDAVTYRLERWPGGDPQEQENLHRMRTVLQAIVLEAHFDSS